MSNRCTLYPMRPLAALLTLLGLLAGLPAAHAQDDDEIDPDVRARGRAIVEEATRHEEQGRHAMAAQRFMDLYHFMGEHHLARAPAALWSAGFNLAQLPGREQDAIRTLRRFLEESIPLESDPDFRQWRSRSATLIAELEARGSGQQGGTPEEQLSEPANDTPASDGDDAGEEGGISPVGPIVVGVGAAVLLPGIITIGVAYSQDQELRARCPALVDCDPAMRPDVESTRNLGVAGDVLWIAGATIALTGLVLSFVLEEGEDDGERDRAELLVDGTPASAVASLRWRLP